jgi:DNA-binding MarR family transcriptional regulator
VQQRRSIVRFDIDIIDVERTVKIGGPCVDTGLLLQYFETQRFLFMAEQCLNLTKKCLLPTLRKYGLNHSQYLVLMVLRYADLTGQQAISTELASLLAREKHTITPLVESLVRRGCVRRSRSRPDRRAIALSLSEKGRALIEQVQPQTMDTVAHLRRDADKPMRTISRFLEEFRRNTAAAAGQNPDLYQSVYQRLLVNGEEKLLETMKWGRGEDGANHPVARPGRRRRAVAPRER